MGLCSLNALRRRLSPWLVLLALLALTACTPATDLKPPKAGATAAATTVSPDGASTDKPKQCYQGCQSWGQSCNVDPRGVYKCQRRCEKFGEVCE